MARREPKFLVDAEGFRELQEGREPWTLAREPVSNSFDERSATTVTVTLTKDGNRPAVLVVEDDGPGFANIRDAYTLYADTYKRRDPGTRGRFNRGEKELLSVALRGSIVTTSGSVHFDGDRRWSGRERLERGTRVSVELRWTKDECEEAVRRLRSFLPPPGKAYTVNGLSVAHRNPAYRPVATLETVLKDDGVLRRLDRATAVHVHRLGPDDTAALMEMGVPVIALDDLAVPFLVDVQQKVPMSPERDSVRPAYLQDVLAEVLNAVAPDLTEAEANARWVNLALPDARVTAATVQTVKERRIGDALILNPFDPLANERAVQAGHDIVSTRGWDPAVVARFRTDADWQTTTQAFPGPEPGIGTDVAETDGMRRTRALVERLSAALGLRLRGVRFVDLPGAWDAADCNTVRGIVFYVNIVGRRFFDPVDEAGRRKLLSLTLHEVGHLGPESGNPYTAHDAVWGNTVADAGAALGTMA